MDDTRAVLALFTAGWGLLGVVSLLGAPIGFTLAYFIAAAGGGVILAVLYALE